MITGISVTAWAVTLDGLALADDSVIGTATTAATAMDRSRSSWGLRCSLEMSRVAFMVHRDLLTPKAL
jgi:hypothetical protein